MMRTFSAIPIILITLSFSAQAAIIENDIELANSFKDTDTGLVWMDFGVTGNVGVSFNDVVDKLGAGGDFEGWQLPTYQQVYAMWRNLVDLDNVVADYEEPFPSAPGQWYVYDWYPTGAESVWHSSLSYMGYNYDSGDVVDFYRFSHGWFVGVDGLSFVDASAQGNMIVPTGYNDFTRLYLYEEGNFDDQADFKDPAYSTLLVRSYAKVTEPSGLVILSLALVGFSARRSFNSRRLN